MSLWSFLRDGVQFLRQRPAIAVLFALPSFVLDAVNAILGLQPDLWPWWGPLLLLPVYVIAHGIARAGYAMAILHPNEPAKPILRRLRAILGPLMGALLLSAGLSFLGLAILLPGLYFLFVYQYVPMAAVLEADAKSPFLALYQSKATVQQTLGISLAVTTFDLVVSFLPTAVGAGVALALQWQDAALPSWAAVTVELTLGSLAALLTHATCAVAGLRLLQRPSPNP